MKKQAQKEAERILEGKKVTKQDITDLGNTIYEVSADLVAGRSLDDGWRVMLFGPEF